MEHLQERIVNSDVGQRALQDARVNVFIPETETRGQEQILIILFQQVLV